MRNKTLIDENGIIRQAWESLSEDKLKMGFLQTLAELTDNNLWKQGARPKNFPHARVHPLPGRKPLIYRADVDKLSGWRVHFHLRDKAVVLLDLATGKEHDRVQQVAKRARGRMRR